MSGHGSSKQQAFVELVEGGISIESLMYEYAMRKRNPHVFKGMSYAERLVIVRKLLQKAGQPKCGQKHDDESGSFDGEEEKHDDEESDTHGWSNRRRIDRSSGSESESSQEECEEDNDVIQGTFLTCTSCVDEGRSSSGSGSSCSSGDNDSDRDDVSKRDTRPFEILIETVTSDTTDETGSWSSDEAGDDGTNVGTDIFCQTNRVMDQRQILSPGMSSDDYSTKSDDHDHGYYLDEYSAEDGSSRTYRSHS